MSKIINFATQLAYILIPIALLFQPLLFSAQKTLMKDEGLVGYWSFDEGEGNSVLDHSGNELVGEVHGEAEWIKTGLGYALSFNGIDTYVDFGRDEKLNLETFSVEAWIKSDELEKNMMILSKYDFSGYGDNGGYMLYLAKKGILIVRGLCDTEEKDIIKIGATADQVSPLDGQWRHIAGVFNTASNVAAIYLDGRLAVKGSAAAGSKTVTSPLTMGNVFFNTIDKKSYFRGLMDDVRLYRRALGTDEIAEHFKAGAKDHPTVSTWSNIEFNFKGEDALKGWIVTKSVTAVYHDDHLEIIGNGWDSKIFRVVELPAGRYVAYGCGAGSIKILVLGLDWKTTYLPFNLSTGKDAWKTDTNGWRMDYRDFEVPGGKCYLTVQVNAEKDTARIKSLKIIAAPPKEMDKDTPTPEALAKETAKLPVVRGFMAGYLSTEDCRRLGHVIPTNENIYSDMREWGANVVRLNIWPVFSWPGLANADFWNKGLPVVLNYIESNVILAQKAGLKVALDCHFPPPVGTNLINHGTAAFWKNPQTAPSLARFWKAIAKRMLPYRDSIYGYDLFNEPLDWDQLPYEPREWRSVAIEIIKAIRLVDKDVWIIYEPGPGGYFRGFQNFVPLPDTRVIYSIHTYDPGEFCMQGVSAVTIGELNAPNDITNVHYPSTIKGVLWNKKKLEQNLAVVRELQLTWHVPIYVGEFSVVRHAPRADAVQWLTDVIDIFESYGWSWTYHSFRESKLWSLEHDEAFWDRKKNPGMGPLPTTNETERAKMFKRALLKNAPKTTGKLSLTVRKSENEPGLIGYWSFDVNIIGTIFDLSGNSLDGKIGGGVVNSKGIKGNAVLFSSEDKSYISLITVPNITNKAISVEILFQADIPQNNAHLVNAMTGTAGFRILVDKNNRIVWQIPNPVKPWSDFCCSTIPLRQGEWTHVITTYDGAVLVIFINGEEAGRLTVEEHEFTIPVKPVFGAYSSAAGFYNGKIDEIKVYNYCLTDDDIIDKWNLIENAILNEN